MPGNFPMGVIVLRGSFLATQVIVLWGNCPTEIMVQGEELSWRLVIGGEFALSI